MYNMYVPVRVCVNSFYDLETVNSVLDMTSRFRILFTHECAGMSPWCNRLESFIDF